MKKLAELLKKLAEQKLAVFTFKDKDTYDTACYALKTALGSTGSRKFDHSEQLDQLTITTAAGPNVAVIKGLLNQRGVKYSFSLGDTQ